MLVFNGGTVIFVLEYNQVFWMQGNKGYLVAIKMAMLKIKRERIVMTLVQVESVQVDDRILI